jgi:hypothetical protein
VVEATTGRGDHSRATGSSTATQHKSNQPPKPHQHNHSSPQHQQPQRLQLPTTATTATTTTLTILHAFRPLALPCTLALNQHDNKYDCHMCQTIGQASKLQLKVDSYHPIPSGNVVCALCWATVVRCNVFTRCFELGYIVALLTGKEGGA